MKKIDISEIYILAFTIWIAILFGLFLTGITTGLVNPTHIVVFVIGSIVIAAIVSVIRQIYLMVKGNEDK